MTVLVFSVLLGGASRQHELRLIIVELLALPLLALAINQRLQSGELGLSKFVLAILIAICAIPALQLIPLPPAIWANLPGHADQALALEVAGLPEAWLPWSLTPDRTWRSLLALIPPVAMFLAITQCSSRERLGLAITLVGVALASVILGAAQWVSGGNALYPWQTTDAGNVVGFFANRNHLATFLLMAIPFALLLARRMPGGQPTTSQIQMGVGILVVLIFLITIAATRSRAGLLILPLVLAGSIVAAWRSAPKGRPWLTTSLIAGIGVAASVVCLFALDPILDRFENSPAHDNRLANWPTVLEAADTYLPLGSGIGSFDAVYRSVEPVDRLGPKFFNQAHNDYLETWLETGWLGLALLVAFGLWFLRRSVGAWRDTPGLSSDLGRAASIAILAVLVHSAFDYPVRTETIAVALAFCCGCLELSARARNGQQQRRSAA